MREQKEPVYINNMDVPGTKNKDAEEEMGRKKRARQRHRGRVQGRGREALGMGLGIISSFHFPILHKFTTHTLRIFPGEILNFWEPGSTLYSRHTFTQLSLIHSLLIFRPSLLDFHQVDFGFLDFWICDSSFLLFFIAHSINWSFNWPKNCSACWRSILSWILIRN